MAELTSVTLIKTYLGDVTGTASDVLLATLLEAAEREIRTLCNRPDGWLSGTTHTEKFYGARHAGVPLVNTPVTAITSVKIFTASGSSTTMAAADYRINEDANGLLFTSSMNSTWDAGFDWPENFVGVRRPSFYPTPTFAYPYTQVVYTGGYAAQTNIPDDLEQLANEYVAWMFWARKEYKPEDHEKWRGIMRENLKAMGYTRMIEA
jgi:hypothetical protein